MKEGWGEHDEKLQLRCAVMPWSSSARQLAPRGDGGESDIRYQQSGRTSEVAVGIAEDCRLSAEGNKGLSRLPLSLSIEVVLFPVLNQNAFQYSCNAAEDAKRKLIQAAT